MPAPSTEVTAINGVLASPAEMRHSRLKAFVAICVALAPSAAGCSDPGANGSSSGTSSVVNEYESASGVSPPSPAGGDTLIELSLRPPVSDEAALEVLRQRQVQTCMQSRGFSYYYPPLYALETGIAYRNASLQLAFPMGDPSRTSDNLGPPPNDSDPNAAYIASLSAGQRQPYFDALLGTTDKEAGAGQTASSSGCLAQSQRKLFGGQINADQAQAAIANMFQDVIVATAADGNVIATSNGWVTCMRSAGFTYQTFAEAAEARQTELAGSDRLGAQLSADKSCSHSSGLAATFRSTFDEKFQVAIQERLPMLDAFLTARKAAIQRALTLE